MNYPAPHLLEQTRRHTFFAWTFFFSFQVIENTAAENAIFVKVIWDGVIGFRVCYA